MKKPSTYPREERRFACQKCGADVMRPAADRFEDFICLNCWHGHSVAAPAHHAPAETRASTDGSGGDSGASQAKQGKLDRRPVDSGETKELPTLFEVCA